MEHDRLRDYLFAKAWNELEEACNPGSFGDEGLREQPIVSSEMT